MLQPPNHCRPLLTDIIFFTFSAVSYCCHLKKSQAIEMKIHFYLCKFQCICSNLIIPKREVLEKMQPAFLVIWSVEKWLTPVRQPNLTRTRTRFSNHIESRHPFKRLKAPIRSRYHPGASTSNFLTPALKVDGECISILKLNVQNLKIGMSVYIGLKIKNYTHISEAMQWPKLGQPLFARSYKGLTQNMKDITAIKILIPLRFQHQGRQADFSP